MNKTRQFLALMLVILTLAACGGGGGGSTDTTSTTNTTTTTPIAPAINGFDYAVNEGDFWEFGWDNTTSYWDSFSGSSTTSSSSRFRVTLGAPIQIVGVTAYALQFSGATDSAEHTPRWKYLSVADNKIMGSSDGTSLVTLFDANTAKWPGSGFFATFSSSTLYTAVASLINNNYISDSAYKVSEGSGSSQCEYFPGVGTICGADYNQNLTMTEYYKEGIGAVGYYFYSSISDLTNLYPWSSTTTYNVGLTKASLRGDIVDYTLEVEPNNTTATATPLTLPAKVMGDAISETRYGGTSLVATTAPAQVIELEPNDSMAAPQSITIPSVVTGSVLSGDAATAVSVTPVSGTTYTASFEDWYKVTLPTSQTLDVNLSFPGTFADLDLYVFNGTYQIMAYSIGDNVANATDSENLSKALSAGTYYIAIDGYVTPRRAAYTLSVSNNGASMEVADWYSFTLAVQSQVTVAISGGPSFVLTDASGATPLASASTTSTETLNAGTYLIGVSNTGPYTLQVTTP